MGNEQRQTELINWLEGQGHSAQEVAKILDKVAEYDAQTLHESVFDSIDSGTIDMQSIVKEALAKSERRE